MCNYYLQTFSDVIKKGIAVRTKDANQVNKGRNGSTGHMEIFQFILRSGVLQDLVLVRSQLSAEVSTAVSYKYGELCLQVM
jgi:hypothetical protein